MNQANGSHSRSKSKSFFNQVSSLNSAINTALSGRSWVTLSGDVSFTDFIYIPIFWSCTNKPLVKLQSHSCSKDYTVTWQGITRLYGRGEQNHITQTLISSLLDGGDASIGPLWLPQGKRYETEHKSSIRHIFTILNTWVSNYVHTTSND